MTENEIGTICIEIAIALHQHFGPGLLESVYEIILAYVLVQRGLRVERQVPITIRHKSMVFEDAFRADLMVEGRVIIELKSVELLSKAHKKQIQTYLRLTGLKLGYILNFGAALMKEGIVRPSTGWNRNGCDRHF